MNARTLRNPRTGDTFETSLLSTEAKELLQARKNESFVSSLLSAYPRLSPAQEFWFFKLAEEGKHPAGTQRQARAGVQVGAGFVRIQELFNTAISNNLKRPKIRLQGAQGEKIVLSLAPATGKNANHIYVKSDDIYCGKISPEGAFFNSRECTEGITEQLQALSDDPAKYASAYGQRTGNCCFCGLELTDGRSVDVGYGPICAGKYGLPWG